MSIKKDKFDSWLKQKIENNNKKMAFLKNEETNIQKRIYRKKVYDAGMLFVETGILDVYNRDEILKLLYAYKSFMMNDKKKPQ